MRLSHGRARPPVAVLVLLACGVLVAVFATRPAGHATRHGIAAHLRALPFGQREGDRGGEAAAEEAGGPAAQQVGDRAWPRSYVTTSRALAARDAVESKPQHLSRSDFRSGASARSYAASSLTTAWQELGPTTPNVPGDLTYTGQPTLNSGRITALAIAPTCVAGNCRLWVGAAGGGVWRTDDALAASPTWTPASTGMTSNAIGSLAVDPSAPNTIYAGTGEPNGSSDSEAGVGLFKSTDGGDHWTLLSGSTAGVASDRSIASIAVQPGNSNHVVIGTALARHGASSVNGARRTPPNAPTLGVYESTDGGASFTLKFSQPGSPNDPAAGSDWFQGGVNKVEFDPNNSSIVYVALTGYGIWRRGDTHDADTTNFHQVFATKFPTDTFGDRTEFALTNLAGSTRIYAGDTSDDNAYARLSRVDNAGVASTTLTDGTTNAGWTLLSGTTPPKTTSDNFCQNQQCGYDAFVAVEPGQPGDVWLGGSMQYDDLGGGLSNGRAVVRSTDSGATFHDMTNDAGVPPVGMHPDQHAIVFAPDTGSGPVAFVGSDGGLVRVLGPYTHDGFSRCAGLPPTLLAPTASDTAPLTTCQDLLSNGPTEIDPINDGLATLQFQSLSVNPADPKNDVMGGTQDNGTWGSSGSVWNESAPGDGGQSVIDSGDPSIRMHTYYDASGDVNFHSMDPTKWAYVTGPLDIASDTSAPSYEQVSFYMPLIVDPAVAGSVFTGMQRVWRTQDDGGDQAQLESDCLEPTATFKDPDCGDWVPIGPDLTSGTFGADRAGQYVVALARAPGDSSTLWAATRTGRLLVSNNANAAAGHVAFDRIDTGATPGRFVSGIVVDPTDPDHAWISYSGYGAYTPSTPQHVIEARYDPTAGTATFTDRSYDLGDAPVTGLARDGNGDLYAATDFAVLRLPAGATAWEQAGTGLPPAAVYGLTLDPGSHLLFAATHGRGAWRLQLPVPPAPPAPAPSPSGDGTDTVTETVTTPAPAPIAKTASRMPRLITRHARRRHDGTVIVTLVCPGGKGGCSGRLTLTAQRRVRGSLVVASKRYSIGPNTVAHLRMALRNTRRVAGGRRISAAVTALPDNGRTKLLGLLAVTLR